MSREAFVHQAQLVLNEGVDPAGPAAAVTTALCGHWEHEGPCRWPHNNELNGDSFRTVFVADADEEQAVRSKIDEALQAATGWSVGSSGPREPAPEERELGRRLRAVPHTP